jgi:hypothetical protein
VATKVGKFVRAQGEPAAFGPPVCVEPRNNATLALARYFLPPSPSALLPRSSSYLAGLFLQGPAVGATRRPISLWDLGARVG